MPSDAPSILQVHNNPTVLPQTSPKKSHKPIPSPRMQDKSTPTDLTCRRRTISLKVPSGVESNAKLEDGRGNSVDSSSKQGLKPEWVSHDSDDSGRSRSRPREAKLDVHADTGTRRSTRARPSHKLLDWSSDSDGGASSDTSSDGLWKANRRETISPPSAGPDGGEGKRPRGRPRKKGSSRSLETIYR